MPIESIKQTQPPEAPNPEQYKFHFEEIEHLREPTKKILEQLSFDIEKGEYQLIIGDDASGRIPVLILNNVIKARYRVAGRHAPEIQFVAGSGRAFSPRIVSERAELIRKIKSKIETGGEELKKALIVTDIIETGSSLSPLVTALKNEGVLADIATMKVLKTDENTLQKSVLGSEVISGDMKMTDIYHQPRISGVQKDVGNLFAEPYKQDKRAGKYDIPPGDVQQDINNARKDVEALSKDLINWYNKNLVSEK